MASYWIPPTPQQYVYAKLPTFNYQTFDRQSLKFTNVPIISPTSKPSTVDGVTDDAAKGKEVADKPPGPDTASPAPQDEEPPLDGEASECFYPLDPSVLQFSIVITNRTVFNGSGEQVISRSKKRARMTKRTLS